MRSVSAASATRSELVGLVGGLELRMGEAGAAPTAGSVVDARGGGRPPRRFPFPPFALLERRREVAPGTWPVAVLPVRMGLASSDTAGPPWRRAGRRFPRRGASAVRTPASPWCEPSLTLPRTTAPDSRGLARLDATRGLGCRAAERPPAGRRGVLVSDMWQHYKSVM